GGDDALEQQLSVVVVVFVVFVVFAVGGGAEVLDQRAGPTVPFRPASSRPVDVRENRTEAADRRWMPPIAAGHEQQALGDIAAHRGEQAQAAEGAEDRAVRRIVEEHRRAALGPTRRGSLREASPSRGEPCTAGVQEHVERGYRSSSSVISSTA